MSDINWQALRAPFPPEAIDFRIQSAFDGGECTVVAYVDARAVAERLDDVVGPEQWSFEWEPLVIANGHVMVAKGTLTICGVSKSDVGDAGDTEPTKSSVSDALKRSAVLWGLARELYNMPRMYAKWEQKGKSKVLAKGEEDKLRAKHFNQRQQPPQRSAEEVTSQRPQLAATPAPQPVVSPSETTNAPTAHETVRQLPASPQQKQAIIKLCNAIGPSAEVPDLDTLSMEAAKTLITRLGEEYQKARRA